MSRIPSLASCLLLTLAAGGSVYCGGREQASRQPMPSEAGRAGEAADSSADHAPSGEQDESGGASGLQLPEGTCGTAPCSSQQICCASPRECGYPVPAAIFGTSCVSAAYQGGELSGACPSSDEYCHGEVCETFAGCTTPSGACGYWLAEYSIWDAEMRIVISAQLGCITRVEPSQP